MVIQGYRVLLLIITLLLPSLVIAQDDQSSCIKVLNDIKPSTGDIARALQNTCDYPVYVFWCHGGTGSAACGGEQRFYTRGHQIEGGDKYFNKYSLPSGVEISVGACRIRRNISFGANGVSSYSCIGDDTLIIQPSDHSKIGCKDGRNISYQWQQKKVTDKVAIVRLTTTDKQRYWVKIDRAIYDKFIAPDDGAVPDVFKAQICSEKEEASWLRKQKNEFIGKVNENSRDEKAACLDELWPSEKCNKILNPSNTNAGTGERQ